MNSPTKTVNSWSDQQIDERVAKILRYGVTAAAVVVSLGIALFLIRAGTKVPNIHREPISSMPFKPYMALADYWQATPEQGLVILGLTILVATPFVRVIFSAYAFDRQNDKTYVAITLMVFTILLFSLIS